MPGPSARTTRWSILHVITKLELGGAQRMALDEVSRLTFATGGRHLAYGPGGLLDAEAAALTNVRCHPIAALGRELRPLADGRALCAIARLVRRLKREEPGRLLVHTHSSKAGVVGRLGAYLAGADCIVHSIHGFGHSHVANAAARRLLTTAERLAGRVTHGFTAAGAANLRVGDEDGLLFGRPRRVVSPGIELSAFRLPTRARAQVRAELGIPAGAPVIVTVANLKPQKDPLCWAEVARQVVSRLPQAVFLFAGDGELRPAVQARLREQQLNHQVRLLGWRQDVADLLHASDLFFLPSRWEGLPQTLPQAMAAGLPVVATAVDGTPEAVQDGDNGLLFAPGDATGMAAAITGLLADLPRRQAMGARGRERAEAFSVEHMLAELDSFYDELTGSAPG